MWLNLTTHFGLRGRQEHLHMLWGDLQLKTTNSGEDYVEFNERTTKTRQGQQGGTRSYAPKMFAMPGSFLFNFLTSLVYGHHHSHDLISCLLQVIQGAQSKPTLSLHADVPPRLAPAKAGSTYRQFQTQQATSGLKTSQWEKTHLVPFAKPCAKRLELQAVTPTTLPGTLLCKPSARKGFRTMTFKN